MECRGALPLISAAAPAALTLYLCNGDPEWYLAFKARANIPSLLGARSFEEVRFALITAFALFEFSCALDPFLLKVEVMLLPPPKETFKGAASNMGFIVADDGRNQFFWVASPGLSIPEDKGVLELPTPAHA